MLLEAGYIPVSNRIRMAKEGDSGVDGSSRALRAQKPIVEVLE